jgi:hypothetical protein
MEKWEKTLRNKLGSELKEGLHDISQGDFKAFTGKQGKIDFEVELERTLREIINNKYGK